MPVEFLGIAATNDGSEISARSGASFEKEYTLRLARAHEETGWDRVLFAYGSVHFITGGTDIGQQVIPIVREEVAKRDQAALDQAGAGAGRPAV